MADSEASRNVLFGVLALQNNLVPRDTIVQAINLWARAKSKPLGQILVEGQALTPQARDLLEGLTEEHLKQHDHQADRSLATLSWTESLRLELLKIADGDVQQTLSQIQPPLISDTAVAGATQLAVGERSEAGQRFRILRPHARGGLGEVYVACDEELHREVALKRIQAPHADNPDSRARFILEAEITGGLEHPSIVPVYGLGCYADGRPFYAMRFIRGDSLKEAIEKFHQLDMAPRDQGERSLEFRKLIGRFIDVCDAIEYAHSRGVLHRDLKPGNIMLGKFGETLVVDWGLAKPQDLPEPLTPDFERRLRPTTSGSTSPTMMGSTIGTPQYMSPEQAEGQLDLLGPASDVYSLGGTLYCLLAGQAPFVDRDVTEVIRKVRQGEIAPPRTFKPTIAPPLEAICLKAMALRPADRYPSARLLADDLEHWLADEPVSAFLETWLMRLARWCRRHRTLVQAAAVALAVITVVALASAALINRARQETDLQRALADTSFRQARESVDDFYTETSENRLLNESGFQDLRQNLLKNALRYYQAFLQQRAGDPGVQEELALAHFRVGKITSEIGSKLDAFASFDEARRMQEELVRRHPAEPRFTYELSNSWNELGRSYLERRQFDPAEVAFVHSRDMRQQLTVRDPKNPEYERKLASSIMNLASVAGSRDQYDAALKGFKQAIEIQQRLATTHPAETIYRRDLAKGYYNLAVLERRAGRPVDALASCRKAMTLFQQLYDEQPRIIDFQGLTALTLRIADELADQAGNDAQAQAAFQQARQLTERLAQRNPLVSDYRAELADVLDRLAGRIHDPQQARTYHIQAKELLVQLAGDNPQVVRYQVDLANQWLKIGRLEHELAHPVDALNAFQQALETSQKLAAQDPGSDDAQDAVAKALTNIGLILRATPNRLADARPTYEQVLKIYQAMAEKHRDDPKISDGLARTYLNLGMVDDYLHRPDDALAAYRSALEHQRRAAELAPQVPGFRHGLVQMCGELAALHREFGRLADSLAVGLEQKKLAAGNAQQLLQSARSLALTAAAIGVPDKLPAEKQALRQQAVDAAIVALREAIAAGLANVSVALTDPALATLKDVPAFRALTKPNP